MLSLIGQKDAEMYFLTLLIIKDEPEITQFIDTVLTTLNGNINFAEIYIRGGAHLVDVSRRIFRDLSRLMNSRSIFALEIVESRKHTLTLKVKL